MHSGVGRHRRKVRKIRRSRQVADCSGLLHTAHVQASRKQRQIRTGDYPPEARLRLGHEVAKARIAAGHRYRTDLADAIKAAGGKVSPRSLQALETGDASVGQAVLFAVASVLPRWTEDTPKAILEGGPAPSADEDDTGLSDEEIIAADSTTLAYWFIQLAKAHGKRRAEDALFRALEVRRKAHVEEGGTLAADA